MVLYRQPIKLVDCASRGADSELFIVEGDSAAGSVVRLRNALYQAVLPIQGKPLNAAKAKETAVRKNPFLAAVIEAVGTDIGAAFSIGRCRYEQILLLCDPDADGIHCATLLLLFFHRWMLPLLESGRVGIIRPPMMQIVGPGIDDPWPAFSEEEGQALVQRVALDKGGVLSKQRFRGLAGIPQAILYSTCIDKATRRIEMMSVADAEACRKMLGG